MTTPNKNLGQHWLRDRAALGSIAGSAQLTSQDIVLEIGPGMGTLTSVILSKAKQVVAVEFDKQLAAKLPAQFPGKNLEVIESDILSFDLNQLPSGYKVVANIPYYITGKIINMLMTAKNKPSLVVLLVQKEVAERLAARPGKMSILAVSAQLFAEVNLGEVVKAEMFSPPPKVDSQVVILKPHSLILNNIDEKLFFRVVKAGFSAKRKKLRSSLSGGLGIPKTQIENMLESAKINPDSRAEALALEDWATLTKTYAGIMKV